MSDNLPTTSLNRFRLPVHPPGMPARPISTLYHKQGVFVVGRGQGTPEPTGLEYEISGSGFGWMRIAKGEKPRYIMDDLSKRTQERDELGDLDRTLWPIGSDGKPLDPWSRVAQLDLVRVQDGTRLIFETTAQSAMMEVEDLVTRICWLARDKGPDARPIMITATKQMRNAKNQSWWSPVFAIVHWNEPDGPVLVPEPQRMPGIEEPTPAVKPSPEAMNVLGSGPPLALRERKPRNAYARLNAKPTGKPGTALKHDLDDELPF